MLRIFRCDGGATNVRLKLFTFTGLWSLENNTFQKVYHLNLALHSVAKRLLIIQ